MQFPKLSPSARSGAFSFPVLPISDFFLTKLFSIQKIQSKFRNYNFVRRGILQYFSVELLRDTFLDRLKFKRKKVSSKSHIISRRYSFSSSSPSPSKELIYSISSGIDLSLRSFRVVCSF